MKGCSNETSARNDETSQQSQYSEHSERCWSRRVSSQQRFISLVRLSNRSNRIRRGGGGRGGGGGGRGRGKREEAPIKTKEELDAELDAYGTTVGCVLG